MRQVIDEATLHARSQRDLQAGPALVFFYKLRDA